MATRKIQYPSVSRVINVPVPYPVVPGGDFPKFDLVQKAKPTQLNSFTNTVYLPAAAVAFQPYVFTQFDQPQPRKRFTYSFDDGWTGIGTPVQNFVFTTFSQPVTVKSQFPQVTFVGDLGPAQTSSRLVFADFDLVQSKRPQQEEWVRFEILPPAPAVVIQPYVFSEFNQPKPTVKVFQENIFNDYEAVANYFFPVFSPFEQPRFKQVRQDPEIQFTIFPVTQVVVTQPYVFGQFSQPQLARGPQAGFTNTVQPASVQTYVFSTFSQPLIKRQVNDQPTWFGSTVVLQPYVFSAFSQPSPLRYQTDANVQTSYYPIVVIPPPNFTGFNDFGLSQQLLGTQQKQDGGYVQFTVLPMPQVISPFFFTGFSDFATMLLTKSTGLIGLNSDQPNVVLQPIIPPPFPVFGPGGTKRWKEGYEALRAGDAIPRSMPVVSSNISEIGYDPEKKELTVEFRTYKYEKVKPKQAKELIKADSYGKYFQSNIKGKHPTTRIK